MIEKIISGGQQWPTAHPLIPSLNLSFRTVDGFPRVEKPKTVGYPINTSVKKCPPTAIRSTEKKHN